MDKYFYGQKISEYGMENGFVDYRALAGSFNAVLNNEILGATQEIGYWEPISGGEDDEEVFQWYIVDDAGRRILEEAGEILWENETLGITLWGVTHWGTSWDYVLTNIKIDW